jgi:hypothetical protein
MLKNSSQDKPKRSIQEFHVDFLLEEEFSSNLTFASSFGRACEIDWPITAVASVATNVGYRGRELDVVVVLETLSPTGEAAMVGLLIENKISAPPQPDQAKTYRDRGEEGAGHCWDDYRTILVAPSAYVGEKDAYQCFVPLEEIQNWLGAQNDTRAIFKRRKIAEALKKKNSSGVQIIDPVMTAFRENYYIFLNDFNLRHNTDFLIPSPKPTWYGDTWFDIKSNELPPWVKMRHRIWTSKKAATGLIEISFPNADVSSMDSLKPLLESNLQDAQLIRNGAHQQHTAIEIRVPEVCATNPFEQERSKLEVALSAGERLWRFFLKHAQLIEEAVDTARAPKAT